MRFSRCLTWVWSCEEDLSDACVGAGDDDGKGNDCGIVSFSLLCADANCGAPWQAQSSSHSGVLPQIHRSLFSK